MNIVPFLYKKIGIYNYLYIYIYILHIYSFINIYSRIVKETLNFLVPRVALAGMVSTIKTVSMVTAIALIGQIVQVGLPGSIGLFMVRPM